MHTFSLKKTQFLIKLYIQVLQRIVSLFLHIHVPIVAYPVEPVLYPV